MGDRTDRALELSLANAAFADDVIARDFPLDDESQSQLSAKHAKPPVASKRASAAAFKH